MEASGIIGYIKPRTTAKGIETFSFTLDDRDDERWFGTYTTRPPEVGTYVEFEYTTNGAGFHNVDNKTLKATEPESRGEEDEGESRAKHAGMAPPKAAAAYTKASNKDANIQWQSARNAAIALLAVAADAGALDLGTGKKGSKLDALLVQTNRLTVEFFEYSLEVSATGETPEDFQG